MLLNANDSQSDFSKTPIWWHHCPIPELKPVCSLLWSQNQSLSSWAEPQYLFMMHPLQSLLAYFSLQPERQPSDSPPLLFSPQAFRHPHFAFRSHLPQSASRHSPSPPRPHPAPESHDPKAHVASRCDRRHHWWQHCLSSWPWGYSRTGTHPLTPLLPQLRAQSAVPSSWQIQSRCMNNSRQKTPGFLWAAELCRRNATHEKCERAILWACFLGDNFINCLSESLGFRWASWILALRNEKHTHSLPSSFI